MPITKETQDRIVKIIPRLEGTCLASLAGVLTTDCYHERTGSSRDKNVLLVIVVLDDSNTEGNVYTYGKRPALRFVGLPDGTFYGVVRCQVERIKPNNFNDRMTLALIKQSLLVCEEEPDIQTCRVLESMLPVMDEEHVSASLTS
jgi:hypothetical protein